MAVSPCLVFVLLLFLLPAQKKNGPLTFWRFVLRLGEKGSRRRWSVRKEALTLKTRLVRNAEGVGRKEGWEKEKGAGFRRRLTLVHCRFVEIFAMNGEERRTQGRDATQSRMGSQDCQYC